jgi:hypothetical protein
MRFWPSVRFSEPFQWEKRGWVIWSFKMWGIMRGTIWGGVILSDHLVSKKKSLSKHPGPQKTLQSYMTYRRGLIKKIKTLKLKNKVHTV